MSDRVPSARLPIAAGVTLSVDDREGEVAGHTELLRTSRGLCAWRLAHAGRGPRYGRAPGSRVTRPLVVTPAAAAVSTADSLLSRPPASREMTSDSDRGRARRDGGRHAPAPLGETGAAAGATFGRPTPPPLPPPSARADSHALLRAIPQKAGWCPDVPPCGPVSPISRAFYGAAHERSFVPGPAGGAPTSAAAVRAATRPVDRPAPATLTRDLGDERDGESGTGVRVSLRVRGRVPGSRSVFGHG